MLKTNYGSVVLNRDVCKKLLVRDSGFRIKTTSGRTTNAIRTTTGTTPRRGLLGFTLVEVVIAILISTIIFSTVIYAYVGANDRSEWSAYSFAAQNLAMQAVEQARTAQWVPENWPPIDNLGTTNYTHLEVLDFSFYGVPILATNFVSISTVTNSPEIRQLRADCVWSFVSRYHGAAGPFTNTAVTFRAADQ
jgi:type II secretory pathway pseudopilin PulG